MERCPYSTIVYFKFRLRKLPNRFSISIDMRLKHRPYTFGNIRDGYTLCYSNLAMNRFHLTSNDCTGGHTKKNNREWSGIPAI